jgi:hypothetical protein
VGREAKRHANVCLPKSNLLHLLAFGARPSETGEFGGAVALSYAAAEIPATIRF